VCGVPAPLRFTACAIFQFLTLLRSSPARLPSALRCRERYGFTLSCRAPTKPTDRRARFSDPGRARIESWWNRQESVDICNRYLLPCGWARDKAARKEEVHQGRPTEVSCTFDSIVGKPSESFENVWGGVHMTNGNRCELSVQDLSDQDSHLVLSSGPICAHFVESLLAHEKGVACAAEGLGGGGTWRNFAVRAHESFTRRQSESEGTHSPSVHPGKGD